MMDFYMNILKNHYADFNGRARRKDYWTFTLINMGIYVVLMILAAVLGSIAEILGTIVGLVYLVFALGILVPSLAMLARRLHDTGKPTWMIILGFVPFVNFYILYLLFVEGDKGENEFGPDPKAGERA